MTPWTSGIVYASDACETKLSPPTNNLIESTYDLETNRNNTYLSNCCDLGSGGGSNIRSKLRAIK